jgi:DNA-binding HxlR family transcriptional regulator
MSAQGVAREDFCPHFQKAIELIGRRWSGTILRTLLGRSLRFSEIAGQIPDISDRSLSARLKELESEQVLTRRVRDTHPVSVFYELTGKGTALERVITEVECWAHDWVASGGGVHDNERQTRHQPAQVQQPEV